MSARLRGLGVLVVLLAVVGCLVACCPEDETFAGDVYIAGSCSDGTWLVPVYWLNDARTALSRLSTNGDGEASGAFVRGSDVYFAGYTADTSGVSVPCVWKNGARTDLSVLVSGKAGEGYSIHVDDAGVVYVCGYTTNATDVKIACFWRAGLRTDLPGIDAAQDSSAWGIVAIGSTTYCAGYSDDSSSRQKAVYWSNSTLHELPMPDGTMYGAANRVVADGTHILITGSDAGACYWRDGVRIGLTDVIDETMSSHANHLAVDQETYYVIGYSENADEVSIPCIWTDGVREDLEVIDESMGGNAHRIGVAEGDIYVTGRVDTLAGVEVPCYWLNGERHDLSVMDPDMNGAADGIAFR